MRLLGLVCLLIVGAIVALIVITGPHAAAIDQRAAKCERMGGVMVQAERGDAVCVQRALPPSTKPSNWT